MTWEITTLILLVGMHFAALRTLEAILKNTEHTALIVDELLKIAKQPSEKGE